MERSTDQVIKAINLEALSKWVGNFPIDVMHDMADLAPMLDILGYDSQANPPNYQKTDFKINDDLIDNYPENKRKRARQ